MPVHTRRVLRRALIPTVCASALVLGTALPASAHVTVSSDDARRGGDDGTLVFRVPTESATARTTRLQVQLPTARPFASVSVRPLDGWRVTTRERKLPEPVTDDGFTLTKAVSEVTWTARPGTGIAPGQFDEFELSVGPFPSGVTSVTLPVVQTYSDGSVVRWDEPTPAGGAEPEHPAPTLELAAATSAADSSADSSAGPSADSSAGPSAASGASPGTGDGLARWLGAGGLLLGLVAVALALDGRRRPS